MAAAETRPEMLDIRTRRELGLHFYNTSEYDLARLTKDPDGLRENLIDYINRFTVDAWLNRKGNNALTAALAPAKGRYKSRYTDALRDGDKAEIDVLDMFRKDVGTFVRLYDFMSQIIDYGDTDLEKRSIFFRLLERLIRPETYTADIDLTGVSLSAIKQIDKGTTDLGLRERKGLKGMTAAGSAAKKDPRMVAFQEVIARLNEVFGDADFTTGQKESFVEALLRTLLEDETLVTQAQANSKSQFLESPDLNYAVVGAVLGNQTSHNKMSDAFFTEGQQKDELVNLIGALVHLHATTAA